MTDCMVDACRYGPDGGANYVFISHATADEGKAIYQVNVPHPPPNQRHAHVL